MFRSALYVSAALFFLQPASAQQVPAPDQRPELLSWDEIVSLSRSAFPGGALGRKLDALLSTPAITNSAARSGVRPKRPYSPGFGPVLRVAEWNLEGGREYDEIRTALGDGSRGPELPSGKPAGAEQAHELQGSDIIVLNEVDLGKPESGYRDVAMDLGRDLGMNVAFGVEFVEVDPLALGLEQPTGTPEQMAEWRKRDPADPSRYRGLAGNAILSRYPIVSARIVRLPCCYDWYGEEKQKPAMIEQGRRWAGGRIFEERVTREIRHGGRMALIVELAVPESSTGILTVVAIHLENYARPACREKQISYLVAAMRDTRGPVVLAGDMNTSGSDVTPTSVRRELTKRATSLKFWAGNGLFALVPLPLARFGLWPLNYFKNYRDPSTPNIPLLLPNRESGLFSTVEEFRFSDGGRFDFSGVAEETREKNGGKLANSNERDWKGFAPTYTFRRTFKDVVGVYKLDWFFVKPDKPAAERRQACCFSPHRPLTLSELNAASGARISDHAPMIVDLYLR